MHSIQLTQNVSSRAVGAWSQFAAFRGLFCEKKLAAIKA